LKEERVDKSPGKVVQQRGPETTTQAILRAALELGE